MKRHGIGPRARLPLLLAAAWLAGCARDAGTLDRREENHPMMRRAIEARREGKVDRAIAGFHAALEKNPSLARAHLDLGLLYDEHKKDYPRAIYHYQRYLEMRPRAEKRPHVESMILYAKYSFAATFPDHPSESIRRIARLEEENRSLRARLEPRLPGGGPPAEAPVPPPVPAPAGPRFVTVERGETLSSIAAREYGQARLWRLLFEANRDRLKDPGDVRPGQRLLLPPQPERTPTP